MKTTTKLKIILGIIVGLCAVYYLITTLQHIKKVNMLTAAVTKSINNVSAGMQPSGIIAVGIEDKIIYSQSFGWADRGANLVADLNTQYPVASITKQFTAVALLKALFDQHMQDGPKDVSLVRHRIQTDLNQPLLNFLPKEHSVWQDSLPAWAKVITLHQLLVHTSGLVNYYDLPAFKKLTANTPYKTTDLIKLIKEQNLAFTPGSKVAYSNAGYLFLGLVIEKITGKTLADYMQQEFFLPLKMQHSFLAVKDSVTDLKKIDPRALNLAKGYEFDVSVLNPQLVEANYDHMEFIGAAGGLISTVSDLLKWNNALYAGKILPKKIVQLLVIPYVPSEQSAKFYGYGLIVRQDLSSEIYGHNGSFAGFATDLNYFSGEKISVISLSNVVPNWDKVLPEIKRIQANLPQDLTANLKWQKTQEILSKRYLHMTRNVQQFDFMALEQNLIFNLDLTLKKIGKS